MAGAAAVTLWRWAMIIVRRHLKAALKAKYLHFALYSEILKKRW